MPKIPTADERIVFSGTQFASVPLEPNLSKAAQGIAGWANQAKADYEADALRRVSGQAAREQHEMGSSGIASPNETWGRQYQEAYRKQAESVFLAALDLDAAQAESQLSEQFADDPDGFAGAWNSYMQGKIEPIEQDHPEGAVAVHMRLDERGMRAMQVLQENAAKKARIAMQAEFLDTVNGVMAKTQDALLRGGDEGLFATHIQEMDQLASHGVESGLITPEQGERIRSNARNKGAEELAYGRFNAAMASGDVGGAKGVIRQLQSGVWFDDNPKGRAVADRLQRELDSMLDGVAAQQERTVTEAFRTLDAIRATPHEFRAGLDSPAATEAIRTIEQYGKPNDLDKLRRFAVGFELDNQLGDRRNQMSQEEVIGAIRDISDLAPDMNREDVSAMTGSLFSRLEEIRKAVDNNDPLAVVKPSRIEPPVDMSGQIDPAFIANRRQLAARIHNASVSAMPVWTKDEIDQARRMYSDATRAGDTDRANDVMNNLLSPGRDTGQMVGIAMQAEIPEFASAAMLHSVLGGDAASQLMTFSEQGRMADKAVSKDARDNLSGVDDVITRAAQALSFGDPALRDSTYNVLANAYVGMALAQPDKSARNIRNMFKDSIKAATDVYTFDNGVRVPRVMISDNPARANKIGKKIDEMLNSPEKFGYLRLSDMAMVHPLFSNDGNVYFRDSRNPVVLLSDPDDMSKPLSVDPVEAVPPGKADRNWRERASEALTSSMEWMDARIGINNVTATATMAGLDSGVLRAAYRAGMKEGSPMGLTQEGLKSLPMDEYEAAWKKAAKMNPMGSTGIPAPMASMEASTIASGVLLDKLTRKYANADKALAAYRVGEDAIDKMGDNWESLLDVETRQFIERVRFSVREQ